MAQKVNLKEYSMYISYTLKCSTPITSILAVNGHVMSPMCNNTKHEAHCLSEQNGSTIVQ